MLTVNIFRELTRQRGDRTYYFTVPASAPNRWLCAHKSAPLSTAPYTVFPIDIDRIPEVKDLLRVIDPSDLSDRVKDAITERLGGQAWEIGLKADGATDTPAPDLRYWIVKFFSQGNPEEDTTHIWRLKHFTPGMLTNPIYVLTVAMRAGDSLVYTSENEGERYAIDCYSSTGGEDGK